MKGRLLWLKVGGLGPVCSAFPRHLAFSPPRPPLHTSLETWGSSEHGAPQNTGPQGGSTFGAPTSLCHEVQV